MASFLGAAFVFLSLAIGSMNLYDLRTQQARQQRLGNLAIDLTSGGAAGEGKVRLHEPGVYRLVLYSLNRFGRPFVEGEAFPEKVLFRGLVGASLHDHSGRVIMGGKAGRQGVEMERPLNTSWTTLGEAAISSVPAESWVLRFHVAEGDPNFSGISSEIQLIPPQTHDIGWYAFEKLMVIGICGIFLIIGGALILVTYPRKKTD